MKQNEITRMPIGYYLKKVDTLLTKAIDEMHAVNGLSRAEWQILHSIFKRPQIDKANLADMVKDFTDITTARQLIEGMIGKGLISGLDQLALTDSGQQLHARAYRMQKGFRKKTMKNIDEAEYGQLIATLEKMILNLS